MKSKTSNVEGTPAVAVQRVVRASAKIPKWLMLQEGVNLQQWKQRKRKELNAVLKAVSAYRMGCLYCPGRGVELERVQRELNALKEAHKVKNWKG